MISTELTYINKFLGPLSLSLSLSLASDHPERSLSIPTHAL
jgi:hypothetical protein